MTVKTILITGCSSGIGAYCARALAAQGWHVFATARDPGDLSRLQSAGFEALYLDYTEPASILAAFEAVLARTGTGPDALFHNGAYAQPGALEDVPSSALRAQFQANVFGWHELTRLIVPHMRARGTGRIVFCSSVLGLVALPYRGAYTASKFAVEALSDTLRLELAGSGVHVSTIQPGPIESRFNEHALDAFTRNIDWQKSVHRAAYEARLAQMEGNRPSRFRRGPEAVFDKLLHALESKRPRPHYRVTTATGIAALCRRLLPRRAIDALARRIY